ncbi:hypothetical protein G210_3827 [Candida maltosa Xu316]|uniref:Uncharacterized protein n=1 Tax=Candida maltosa (strain Xu316) TaxID=1245528 RepID=M3IHY9_CANMX|nr:hypothetical protein G210_3827 [Candida maltosa Xu316]
MPSNSTHIITANADTSTNMSFLSQEYTGLVIFFALCCLFILLTVFYFNENSNLTNYTKLQQTTPKDLEANEEDDDEDRV